MKSKACNSLIMAVLLSVFAVPCRAEQPDIEERRNLYNCQKKAAEYTYNLDRAGDQELFDKHVADCMEVARSSLKSPPAAVAAHPSPSVVVVPHLLLAAATPPPAKTGIPVTCESGTLLPNYDITSKSFTNTKITEPPDLLISGKECVVTLAKDQKHVYRYVNIQDNGRLVIQDGSDGDIHFWVKSILVEKDGALKIGDDKKPIKNRTVTIHLYGKVNEDPKEGIACNNNGDMHCGVSADNWKTDGIKLVDQANNFNDMFYAYDRLPTDDDKEIKEKKDGIEVIAAKGDRLNVDAYFGRKAIAVSYGGSLQMFGSKGVKDTAESSDSGYSWARLAKTVNREDTTLMLDRYVDWVAGDLISITPTDYLPGHAETLKVKSNATDQKGFSVITLDVEQEDYKLKYRHNGEKYTLDDKAQKILSQPDGSASRDSIETRAAVALLSRSIRIVSNYDYTQNNNEILPNNNSVGSSDEDSYFGGHVIARQGFKTFQMRGVELFQLGQGGRMAHVPINFYRARKVPDATYVKDCSIWDSMNHWIELRATHGVRLERNVGYKSIGHGFVIADGAEINNSLIANIGIYARPGSDYKDNPRKVPGVLSQPNYYNDPRTILKNTLAYGGDVFHPAPFMITNAYNTLEYNMAAGTGACGSCFWYAPARNGSFSNMIWDDFMAKTQENTSGSAIIKSFKGNFCSTSMYSLVTVGDVGACLGIMPRPNTNDSHLGVLPNRFSKIYASNGENANPAEYPGAADLVPRISSSGFLQANTGSIKDSNCSKLDPRNCGVNVIDSYTSSFHWAENNFSAIWLRLNWFLFTDSALTDVQNGGLTMVSGGSYDQVPAGYWALTRRSVFVGKTQKENDYATEAGPKLSAGGLSCSGDDSAYCLLKDKSEFSGISFPTANFNNYQRFINIYDGPVYLHSNVFLDINKTPVPNCKSGSGKDACAGSGLIYGGKRGMPIPVAQEDNDPLKGTCVLTNAAIGWKQPNGFYYPPAFHMSNLYFGNVDVRHFVIVPPFKPGTMDTDIEQLKTKYCSYSDDMFDTSWTDIDRQTEINDDDGSLSGVISSVPGTLKGSISVNNDKFFTTPSQALECKSEQSCFQTPYDHLNLAVIPDFEAGRDQQAVDKCLGDCMAERVIIPDKQYCSAKKGKQNYCNYTKNETGTGEPGEIVCKNEDLFCPKSSDCKQYCDTLYPVISDDEKNNQHVAWGKECLNRWCAGVPIYRQYLVKDEKKSDEQGIRMMGAGISQRSIMIANNGKYFIDTTRDEKMVGNTEIKSPTKFIAGNKYNFFMLYAKNSTKVTYQLYVGEGLEKADVFSRLKLLRVGNKSQTDRGRTGPLVLVTPLVFAASDWPWNSDTDRSYDQKSGILEFKMDLGKFSADFSNAAEESCQPKSYCKWENGSCVRSATKKGDSVIDYLDNDSKTCGEWSVKSSECPSNGCIGFQIAFPADYDAQKNKRAIFRPEPVPYPADWNNGATLSISSNTGGTGCETPATK
jgi:hypothetical protein